MMPDHIQTALFFEGRAQRARHDAERIRFMAAARKYRDMAAEQAKATASPSEADKTK
jgi:hypothetical protein